MRPNQGIDSDALEPSDGQSRAGPTRYRYYVLAVGCGLGFLAYVHRQSFVMARPDIQNALALDEERMSYLQSAFLVGYGLFQVPCGSISDRFGARHVLTLIILSWSLLTGVTALAGTPWADFVEPLTFLLCARFAFGALQAGFFPVWSRVITDWIPLGERATAQGFVWMFSRVGGAAGPLFFFWLYRIYQTWTTPLWVLAAVGMICCVPFWLWFRNWPEQVPSVNLAERDLIAAGRVGTTASSRGIPWLALFGSLNVWSLCLMYGFVGSAGNFITNLLPDYLRNHRELSREESTLLTGLPLAVGVISCVSGGLLSDWIVRRWGSRKWGRRINGMVGLVLAGLALLAVPWAKPVWLLAVLLSASFFCNDLILGPAWAACADVGEQYAGTISGAMNMTGQFSGAAGMAVAGWMLKHGHVESLFLGFGCAYALAALCWLGVDVTKPLATVQNHATGQSPEETR